MKLTPLKVLLTLFISTTFAFSITPIAYHVQIESPNNSKMTVPVAKLEMGEYQINSLFVKTKSKIEIDGNRFVSDVLNKGFENVSISKLNKVARGNSNKVNGTPVERLYVVEYAIGVDSYDIAQELMKNPEIEYAVPVFNRYTTDFTPDDPELSRQWYINSDAKQAWDITKGSTEVVIAIVDSGTDWTHPDLLPNIYINPAEIPDNGIDDDKNGYIDDVNGWDFVGNLTYDQVRQRRWEPDNDPKPEINSNDHGTHVAGCASAATNNGVGVASLGFNTKLMPIKCGADNWNDTRIKGIYRGYEGIMYAAENGADIINCSWGGKGFNPAEQEIINSIVDMGILIVASAGNDSENIDEVSFYPTGYNNVLSVGSITTDNSRSTFTNYGIRTDIYAPGTRIYATLPGDRYGYKQGTSMAGPVAAGLAGLIKAINPSWTPHQIAAQMRSTTDPIEFVKNEDKPLYYGRINPLKALQANANNFSQNKTIGMAFSETDFSINSVIKNYEENTFQLKLINYLAPVAGVKIEFVAMDKYIDIVTSEVILNSLTTLDTSKVGLTIKLNDLNPWYDGFARVLVKYTATGYSDYQLLKIPIVVQSNNSFNYIAGIAENEDAIFNDVHSPYNGSVWAVGYSTSSKRGVVFNTTANLLFDGGLESLTGIYAKDGIDAWATTVYGNLLVTSNSGRDWEKTDFSGTTGYFNGIGFFNASKGIALGNPLNNQFGVIVTTDGGNNWASTPTLPPIGQEVGVVGVYSIFGDRVWFGTTAGRVLRGRDFGKTWTASVVDTDAKIIALAFNSNNNGIAIYTNQSETGEDYILAKSSDGGLNWTPSVSNLTETIGAKPVELIYNEAADKIFLICKNGEVYSTDNLGGKWTPVLSRQIGSYHRADIVNTEDRFRIYGASESIISSLDFTNIPSDPGTSIIAFDTFDKGLNIYPQPARNEINIQSISSTNIRNINLLDLSGKILKEFDSYNPTALNTYSTADLSSGVYLLQFVTNSGTFYKKIVIE